MQTWLLAIAILLTVTNECCMAEKSVQIDRSEKHFLEFQKRVRDPFLSNTLSHFKIGPLRSKAVAANTVTAFRYIEAGSWGGICVTILKMPRISATGEDGELWQQIVTSFSFDGASRVINESTHKTLVRGEELKALVRLVSPDALLGLPIKGSFIGAVIDGVSIVVEVVSGVEYSLLFRSSEESAEAELVTIMEEIQRRIRNSRMPRKIKRTQ